MMCCRKCLFLYVLWLCWRVLLHELCLLACPSAPHPVAGITESSHKITDSCTVVNQYLRSDQPEVAIPLNQSQNKTARGAFAARLRQALDEAGYGKAQLKEIAGLFEVTPQAVRKWLSGESLPSSTRAGAVAALLGVRRAWLMDGEPPVRLTRISVGEQGNIYSRGEEALLSISGSEYRLLQNFRRLPRPVQQAMEVLLKELAAGNRA